MQTLWQGVMRYPERAATMKGNGDDPQDLKRRMEYIWNEVPGVRCSSHFTRWNTGGIGFMMPDKHGNLPRWHDLGILYFMKGKSAIMRKRRGRTTSKTESTLFGPHMDARKL